MSDEYRNEATGNASVGGQFGKVTGNARIGPLFGRVTGDVSLDTPGLEGDDLQRLLPELLTALSEALASGQLDTESFEAATAEVRTAEACLTDEGEGGRRRLMIALKRLKGIVEDVSDLVGKVATTIAAVHGVR
jgi:8-oxo-dGTP diphosphatase